MIHRSYHPIWLCCEHEIQHYYCYQRRYDYEIQHCLCYHLDYDYDCVIRLQHLYYRQYHLHQNHYRYYHNQLQIYLLSLEFHCFHHKDTNQMELKLLNQTKL